MKKQINLIILITLLVISQIISIQVSAFCNEPEKESLFTTEEGIKVSIIYDNYDFKDGMKSDWGFSCLIEGTEKTILFDTGAKPKVFKQNFDALNIDAQNIDYVVISHDHYDHTGVLSTFLAMNNDVSVYILESFSKKIKETIEINESKTVYEPVLKEICNNVYLSGILGEKIEEQSLAINTSKGLVVITGCSHPGIIEILKHFKSSLNKEIYMVFGGFHLMRKNDVEMAQIIQEMKHLGVKKCGATHCTGDHQIELFKEAFGDNYVSMGVGNTIEF
jgi:7,8-dihydropterin-6-yl-methyl-4-(beta-D-ribofuranosyl)aminobenzene 5'-phosphate synthase